MRYSDDDLDRLFSAAKPAARPNNHAPDAADIAIREGIIRGTHTRGRHAAYKGIAWAGPATAAVAAAVAGVVVAVAVLMPTQHAVALTPPPLHYTAAAPWERVFNDAQAKLRTGPDQPQVSAVNSVIWAWNADLDTKHVEIVPQNVTFDWGPGEPSTTTVVAGDSFWSDSERPEGIERSPYRPGELIDTYVIPPEDFALAPEAAELRGSSREELSSALAVFGATPDASSGDLLAAITGLLQYWTLDDEQHATLLDLLADAGDLTVRGETTDRLGRDVVGVQVSQVIPERQETLFISKETGRIVGVESELLKPLDGLPVGVITYTMWDAPEHVN